MEFQKISVPSPPQHTEGNENSEGRGLESTETEVNINQLLDELFVISGTMWSSRKYPYPPPPPQHTEGNENSEGRGGGEGVRVFFGGAPSKIDEQTNSYFSVNRCSKAKINVFIDDLLLAVG